MAAFLEVGVDTGLRALSVAQLKEELGMVVDIVILGRVDCIIVVVFLNIYLGFCNV